MAGENINRKLNIYINDKEVVNSLSGITREMGKTRNELKNLNKNSADYDADLARLTKHLSDLNEKQTEFKDELKLTNKEMGAARENFSNLLSGIAAGDMNAVQAGMMGIRGSIIATTQAAWAFLATPAGAFVAVFAGLGLAAKEVVDFNESIKESNQLLDNLGVDSKLRPSIQGIADTYKVGFEQIAKSIDDMVDLGLVKNEFEALDKIKEGLVKAPDKNEFLSTLQSNGIAAKNLGLQLEGVISLNESFEASGANAEAIFGALQKSSSTLILQSPQLKKSMEAAFGAAFTSDLLAQVKSGSITYYDALDKIYKKGEELGVSNQTQAQLAKDLFGKSAIAAGGYEMILGNVAAAHRKNTQALTETQIETQKLADSNVELAKAQDRALKSDGYNKWKNTALIAINSVKAAWYDFVGNLTNGAGSKSDAVTKEIIANAQKSFETRTTNSFSTYIKTRARLVGESFSYEVEKENYLANLRSEYSKVSGADATKAQILRQKQLETEMDFIKRIKLKAPEKKKAVDGTSDTDTKAADSAAKSREKQLSDAKKHSEDLIKQENDTQKSLNDTRAKANELKSGLIKDDYARESALINAEYDKKIEDLELNITKEQEAIDKLKAGIASPKTSSEDLVSFKKQLKDRLEIQENHNQTMLLTDQTRDFKLGALQEKFLQKQIQDQEKANARDLLNLHTKQNNELAGIKTLEDAKAVLSQTLSADELAKIKTLDDAKKAIKEKHLKEEYDLQLNYLNNLAAEYKNLLDGQTVDGLKILTSEQRDEILANLDAVANKISEITLAGSGTTPDMGTKADGLKTLSSLDILGSTPEQWDAVFGNLSTAESKIAAVTTVVNGLQNAFGMYFQFLEAGEKRTLQKFEASTKKKKDALSDQLEKGAITQEVYNARTAKLDADLAKKKAEIEYKQAKRQKAMQAAQIISSTALAIMGIWAQVPKFDFGISAGVLTGVVAGLGAAQLGLLLAQPLPDKNGFYVGGYTGSGNEKNSPGPVHYDEYVIPKKVLFSNDPLVPNIVGYLESKRTGKQPLNPQEETGSSANSQGGSSTSQETTALAVLVSRAVVVLEKLEGEGVEAFLVNDIKTAKKMRDKIKEVTKLETNAKV